MTDAASIKRQAAMGLLVRIAGGDGAAEGELMALYSRNLRFLLEQRTGDVELAADLHQEVFCIVLQRLRRRPLEEPEKFAAFLHQTAKNQLIGHRRKVARRQTDADSDAVARAADHRHSQLDDVLQDEQTRLVRRLLGELASARDRGILMRFYLYEEEKATICRDLELTEAHFNRVLFRARQRFKQLIERTGNLSELRPRDDHA